MAGSRMVGMTEDSWTLDELQAEAERYVREARARGLADSTVQTYEMQTRQFIRWLAGEMNPLGPQHQ